MTDSQHHNQKINAICLQLGHWLVKNSQQLVTVESCTGGGIAAAITDIPGSSAWFERGFVTYSNLAKQELVDVPKMLIDQYGAVSEQVANAMAIGGLKNSAATVSLSVTGIAGPDGGSNEKPVGTVCFGRAQGDKIITTTQYFHGDRQAIRNASIIYALEQLVYTTNS